MDTPQKRQKSWFSSLTGLVTVGRSPTPGASMGGTTTKAGVPRINGEKPASLLRHAQTDDATPMRYSGTFSAPPVESPESPAKRASPSLLAQRKIHDRVQGPSVRLNAAGNRGSRPSTVSRRTNFSSMTTPRNIFRNSLSRDTPAFEFTPRVPPNTIKGTFPMSTPGRSFRTSGIELTGREMAKTTSSELFPMKIPDPDPKLSGEVIAKMVPRDDFNDEQRNQFFCILDLRRLKYAADEVFLKKDWRLNILNFAKEYEKNRSLIMLRYGLYEFKTVKVSKDTFQKWKAAHNIPDLEDEDVADGSPAEPTSRLKTDLGQTSKLNGTEGILRSGKRKARETLDPVSAAPGLLSSAVPTGTNKRPRPVENSRDEYVEREPLSETKTPALNKSKRRAIGVEGSDLGVKPHKTPANYQPTTASATKAFLEKVANSPAKISGAEVSTPSAAIEKQYAEPTTSFHQSSTKPPVSAQQGKTANGSLARSVLESGLKANATQGNNIFGYLSDASSAKGSGNDNADADAEDTEESDGSENFKTQEASKNSSFGVAATPARTLLSADAVAAATQNDATASETPAGTNGASPAVIEANQGRSLFDRVNKGSDGQPIRLFGNEHTTSSAAASVTTAPAESTAHMPGTSLFVPNKTWSPDTPIKFAGTGSTSANSVFGGPANTASIQQSGKGSSSTEELPTSEQRQAVTSVSTTSKLDVAAPNPFTTTPAVIPGGQPTATSLFNFPSKPVDQPTTTPFSIFSTVTAESTKQDPPSVGSTHEKLPSVPVLGSSASPSTKLTSPTPQPKAPLGHTLEHEINSTATSANSVTSIAPSKSIFGTDKNGVSSADKAQSLPANPLFGSSFASPQASVSSASIFSVVEAKSNGARERTVPPAESFAPTTETKPAFSFGGNAAAASKPIGSGLFSAASEQAPIFGGFSAGTTQSENVQPGSIFSFGGTTAATSEQQSTSKPPASAVIFGRGDSGSGASSFSFSMGTQPFNNPFAGPSATSATPGTNSGTIPASPNSLSSAHPMVQNGPGTGNAGAAGSSTGLFSNGPATLLSAQPSSEAGTGSIFGKQTLGNSTLSSPSVFSFGAGAPAQSNGTPAFGQLKPATGTPIFNLTPAIGGASTGTNTPFTNLGGASSLATTPATGTPEPGAAQDNIGPTGQQADGNEAPQEQISLTEGGPGEEDEVVIHEVRSKALKLATKDGSESDSPKDNKSPWKTEGVGPLRVLKHKTSGAVRLLLRAEPRGNIALNKTLLPEFTYKPEPNSKYVKLTTASESGTGLETWMVQVKTKEAARKLADVLEEHKTANKK